MTISATIFVDVSVQLAAASVDRFSFGRSLFIAEHNVVLDRYAGPYASISEVEDAGFTAAAALNVHRAATAYFGVANSGDEFAVGRKISSAGSAALAVLRYDESTETYTDLTADFNAGDPWSPLEASEAEDDEIIFMMPSPFSSMSFDVATQGAGGTVAWQYWDGNAWVAVAGITDGTVGFTSNDATQVVSWTPPINWAQAEVDGNIGYAIKAVVTSVYSTNPSYDDSFIGGDASWTEAASAILAVAGDDGWYYFTADTKTASDVIALTAWGEARKLKRYISQNSDLALLAGTPGNIGEVLNAAAYKQNVFFYRGVSTGDGGYTDNAVMGKLSGFNLEAAAGNQPLIFQTLEGQLPDGINTTQANYLHSIGVNIYATAMGSTFASKGTASAGPPWFVQIQTAIDYADRRLTEDLLSYLVATKPPMNNFGIQGGAGVIQARLLQMVENGMLNGDLPIVVSAPDIEDVSEEDRAAGIVRYGVTAFVLNSIVKIFVDVKFEF